MYTRASSQDIKKKVLALFMTTGNKLRVVIATTAFSIGIDCPDIQNVIQVEWCHTVNTMNRPGYNIPMDLYLEHLNRRVKTILENMGSNVTNRRVKLAAESVGTVNEICHVFERQCSSSKEA